jgi:hypothetical protein
LYVVWLLRTNETQRSQAYLTTLYVIGSIEIDIYVEEGQWPPVLWIQNFLLRIQIRIRLFNEFRIQLSKNSRSGYGSDLFGEEI